MKYDALHNRQFLETMFNPGDESLDRITNVVSEASNLTKDSSTTTGPPRLPKLRELYLLTKVLFEYALFFQVSDYSFVSPQEYGIENDEKLDIGLLTSMPLVQQILADVREIEESERAKTKIYFTKGTIILISLTDVRITYLYFAQLHFRIRDPNYDSEKRITRNRLSYTSQL